MCTRNANFWWLAFCVLVFKAMFGTRNPKPGKCEGKKIGKKDGRKEKAREGKINFFLVWLFMENSKEKDKDSIFPCLIIYDLKKR